MSALSSPCPNPYDSDNEDFDRPMTDSPNPTISSQPIPELMRDRFDYLVQAAKNDQIALVSAACAKTGEPRYVLCAIIGQQASGDDTVNVDCIPIAHLTPEDDPTDAYIPSEEFTVHKVAEGALELNALAEG